MARVPGEPLLFTRKNGRIQENKKKYKWVTNGANCDTCNLMRGRVYALIVWWDTIVPGFHPCCDCSLEPVGDDTPESSLQFFGVVPWIDRLDFSTYTRWMIKRYMPWDVQEVYALAEAYDQKRNWKDAFAAVKKITHPNSYIIDFRYTLFNTQYPLSPVTSWFDGKFTTRVETAPTPSADLPWESQ